ncbi:MAG: FAD:protein FMN transferase [Gallionellaceae bacterium]|jgi:thiamine biosynthesis lipoprotein
MKFASRALLLAALLLSACTKEDFYQEESFVFGTRVEISIYGSDENQARNASAAVMQEFQRLHQLLHAWKPSALSELNSAFAAGKTVSINPELEAILRDASALSQQSGGLFNPSIGGLVRLWGFQADEFLPALPEAKQLAALVAAQPQMGDISFRPLTKKNSSLQSVASRNRAVQLDLGGYAKGYALDRAAALLKQRGIQHALINIGGNIMALGTHGSRPWRVGIQHPRKPGPLATLELHDGEAIGTSGDYQRYFELDGKRYCHLLDPRNGQPVQGVQAVTVLTRGARAGILSDAASKPVFIAGAGAWLATAQKMQLNEVLLIDADGTVHLTTAMQKRLEFKDKNIARKLAQ